MNVVQPMLVEIQRGKEGEEGGGGKAGRGEIFFFCFSLVGLLVYSPSRKVSGCEDYF